MTGSNPGAGVCLLPQAGGAIHRSRIGWIGWDGTAHLGLNLAASGQQAAAAGGASTAVPAAAAAADDKHLTAPAAGSACEDWKPPLRNGRWIGLVRDAQLHPPLQVERPELPPAVRRRAVESGDVT